MNLLEEKSYIRKLLITRRNALSDEEHRSKDRKIHHNLKQIDEFIHAKSIFCFISYQTEVETHSLIKQWLASDVDVAVPKIVDKTTMHSIKLNSWDDLEPDRLGILNPRTDEIAIGPFDISITPGVAFTKQGARLGYGRGYYDRWFANNEVKKKIGICYEEQILDELPTEITDVMLDQIITDN